MALFDLCSKYFCQSPSRTSDLSSKCHIFWTKYFVGHQIVEQLGIEGNQFDQPYQFRTYILAIEVGRLWDVGLEF